MNNTSFFLVAFSFLASVANQLTAQLWADIQSGKKALIPETLYLRKEISGGSIITLLDTNSRNKAGVCNFDENVLRTGRILIFDQIAFNYGTTNVANAEGSVNYNGGAPIALLNAIFTISQDGVTKFSKPVKDICNTNDPAKVNDEYTDLKALSLLVDDKQISLTLEFPQGVNLPNDVDVFHYIEVRLNGLATSARA